MKFRIAEIAVFGIVVFSFLIAVYYYPLMPAKIASHWNAQGQVDGYWDKFWALFIMPLILIALFAVFLLIPRIDPLRKNIQQFRKHFDIFIVLFFLFLLYLFLLTIGWNLGWSFNMIQFLSPAFGLLFFYVGILLKHAKPNWSIGIRTPWTLSNEKVWEKTHEIGGKLFKASGFLAVFGVLLPDFAIWLVLVPVIIAAIYSFAFSYFEFEKIKKKRK